MAAADGVGTTVVFGTSAFSANLLTVTQDGITRPAIPSSHLGTANNYNTFIPGELVDGGTLEMEIEFDPPMAPPITSAAEAITVDWGGDGDTYAFSGFIIDVGSISAAEGERMTATITVKVTGPITGI